MMTVTKVQTMFNAIDYAAEMAAWYQAQSDKRQAAIADYSAGWYIHRAGGMSCDCANKTQLAGWDARRDNENWALLVADALKLKVRE